MRRAVRIVVSTLAIAALGVAGAHRAANAGGFTGTCLARLGRAQQRAPRGRRVPDQWDGGGRPHARVPASPRPRFPSER